MATGHVRKRGKKWAYVQYVTDPVTGKGKYRWKSGFATKHEAQRALREAITAVEKGTFIEPSKMTYAEYVERIWLLQLDDQLEGSTIESYERNMRVHVLPRIGGVKLQQLGPIHLNDLYRDLQSYEVTGNDSANRRHDPRIYPRIAYLRSQDYSYAAIAEKLADEFPDQKPLSKNAVAAIVRRSKNTTKSQGSLAVRTVRYIHTIISRSLKDAVKLCLVNDNVAKNASPPRKPKTKTVRPMWTAEQTRTFLDWARADEHRLWVAWAFIATSGDRRGANLGLRWQDIDFDNGDRCTHVDSDLCETQDRREALRQDGREPRHHPRRRHALNPSIMAVVPEPRTTRPRREPRLCNTRARLRATGLPRSRPRLRQARWRLPPPRTIQPRVQASPTPFQPGESRCPATDDQPSCSPSRLGHRRPRGRRPDEGRPRPPQPRERTDHGGHLHPRPSADAVGCCGKGCEQTLALNMSATSKPLPNRPRTGRTACLPRSIQSLTTSSATPSIRPNHRL